MTSWAKPGTLCVCIDDFWEDFWEDGSLDEVHGPSRDELVTIIDVALMDGFICAKISGWSYWWQLSAFRPLSSMERDALLFSSFLTGSFEPARTLEPSCSS